jgi:NADH-quinone oxidoreductase subunit J
MHLLSGLIVLLVVFALLRALLPGRPLAAWALLVSGAATLVAIYRQQVLGMEFWAGAVGFVAILSALLVVMHPNPMSSVLFLILNLFCVALFYLMLQAQLLAVLQLIVYAGAIMVLFVFVVMLLNLKAEQALTAGRGMQRWAALLLGALFASMMYWAIRHRSGSPYFDPQTLEGGFGTARGVAMLLFRDHAFAFEAAGLLLVAAMVGAVILAKRQLR